MATTSGPYQVRRVTIDMTTFTPISPAIDCQRLVLSRDVDDTFLVRTDPNDPGTQKAVASGWAHEIKVSMCLMTQGVPVLWVEAGTTVGVLTVESFR